MYKLTNTGQEVQDALNAVLEKSAGGHLKEATTSSSGLMSAADKQRLREQENEIDAIDRATQRAQAKAEAAFTRAGEAMTHSINLSEKRVNGQQLKYGVDLTGEDIPVNPVTKDTVAQALGKRVEITLRINGKQLNEDVTLTASDIDAGGKSVMDRLQDLIAGKVDNTIRINNYVLNKSVNLSAQDINLTKDSGKSIYDFIMALDTNKVNKTTAINGQPLTGNVTLTGEDIPSLAIQDYHTVDEALHRLDGDKVDKTTKVNGKALSGDVNIDADDIRYNTEYTVSGKLTTLDYKKADLNPQGSLATGQEQRLVVTFINTGSAIVKPTVAGVYYNGQTKKVETYEEQGSATVSMVVKVLSETPSQNVVYCDKAENKLWRWSGTAMVQLSSGGGDSYTKAESDALLAGKASATSQVQMNYEEEPVEVDTNLAITLMSTGINNHIHDTDEALHRLDGDKADKTEVYTKEESDALFANKGTTNNRMQAIEESVHGLEYDLNYKQDKLVSGTNIKTINGESIVGSGDITIEGGGVDVVQTTGTSTTAVMSQKAVTEAIEGVSQRLHGSIYDMSIKRLSSMMPMLVDINDVIKGCYSPLNSISVVYPISTTNDYIELSANDAANMICERDGYLPLVLRFSNDTYKTALFKNAIDNKLYLNDYEESINLSSVISLQSVHDTKQGDNGQHLSAYGYRALGQELVSKLTKANYRVNTYVGGLLMTQYDEVQSGSKTKQLIKDGDVICTPSVNISNGWYYSISKINDNINNAGWLQKAFTCTLNAGEWVDFDIPISEGEHNGIIAIQAQGNVTIDIYVNGGEIMQTFTLIPIQKEYTLNLPAYSSVNVRVRGTGEQQKCCLYSIRCYDISNILRDPVIKAHNRVAFLGASWTVYPSLQSALAQGIPSTDEDMQQETRPDGTSTQGCCFWAKQFAKVTGCNVDFWGFGGKTTEDWGLPMIDTVLTSSIYDVVVINLIINDNNQHIPLQTWKSNLQAIADKCIRAGARPIIIMPPITSSKSQAVSLGIWHEALLDGFDLINI